MCWATRTGAPRCGPIPPGCCCRASARVSSPWPPASTRPGVGAADQSLHHFVAKAPWDDATLLEAVRDYALPAMLERGPIRAWIVDDTGLPKKGKLSVGV